MKKTNVTKSIFIFEKQEDLLEFWNGLTKESNVTHSTFIVFKKRWFHKLLEIIFGVDKRHGINFIEQEKV